MSAVPGLIVLAIFGFVGWFAISGTLDRLNRKWRR